MDSLSTTHDDVSDYGSDFTLEEETELNKLLQQIPKIASAGPAFAVNDILDNELPSTARLPWRASLRQTGHIYYPTLPISEYEKGGSKVNHDLNKGSDQIGKQKYKDSMLLGLVD